MSVTKGFRHGWVQGLSLVHHLSPHLSCPLVWPHSQPNSPQAEAKLTASSFTRATAVERQHLFPTEVSGLVLTGWFLLAGLLVQESGRHQSYPTSWPESREGQFCWGAGWLGSRMEEWIQARPRVHWVGSWREDQRKGVRGRGNSTGDDLGTKSLFAEQPVVCFGHSVEVSGKG